MFELKKSRERRRKICNNPALEGTANERRTENNIQDFKLDGVLRIFWLKIEINMIFKLIHAMNSTVPYSVGKCLRVEERLRSFVVAEWVLCEKTDLKCTLWGDFGAVVVALLMSSSIKSGKMCVEKWMRNICNEFQLLCSVNWDGVESFCARRVRRLRVREEL